MLHKNFENFTWIYINLAEGDHQVEQLLKTISLAPQTQDIILSPIHIQRIEEYDSYITTVLHYPLHNRQTRTNQSAEIDFIIGPEFLITVVRNEIHFLVEIFQDKKIPSKQVQTPVDLYLFILETMMSACLIPLNRIAEKMNFVEAGIFNGQEKNMISEISLIKRDVLDFRKIIRLQKAAMEASFRLLPKFFADDAQTKKNYGDIISTNIYIWQTLENLKEVIESYDNTNQALLSHKLNENIRILTIFSATMAPAGVIATILGSTADPEWILQSPFALGVNLFVVFFTAGFCYVIFKNMQK
jgi:magnesium transporter